MHSWAMGKAGHHAGDGAYKAFLQDVTEPILDVD